MITAYRAVNQLRACFSSSCSAESIFFATLHKRALHNMATGYSSLMQSMQSTSQIAYMGVKTIYISKHFIDQATAVRRQDRWPYAIHAQKKRVVVLA